MQSNISQQFSKALDDLQQWKNSFGAFSLDESLQVYPDTSAKVFNELIDRLKGNFPFHHPVYAGQMLKSPHDIAWAAYALASSINPNNHALDGGPPSSEMEKEIMPMLAKFLATGIPF